VSRGPFKDPAAAWHNGVCLLPLTPEQLQLLTEALNDLRETKIKALAILKAEGGRFAGLDRKDVALPEIEALQAHVETHYIAEPED
jgi:hypothetical protein